MSDRIAFTAKVSAEGRRIRGSVTLAGQRARRNGEWVEVEPAAIVKADASNVVGRWEHDPHKILGRVSNGTLKLSRTDQGIEYEMDGIPNVSYANDALELVNGGYVTGSSFEIEGQRSRFYSDPETGERVRQIYHIDRLVDVSPVGDPAFLSSTAQAFSKESDMAEKEIPPPDPQPDPQPDPPAPEPTRATFTASEMSREAAEQFAREQPTEAIVAFMDNVLAATKGNMNASQLDQYEGFGNVLAERKKKEAANAERIERFQALHDMRLGRIPKAPESTEAFASDEYNAAFSGYLRTGRPAGLEAFAQSIAGSGAEGGFTVPDGFLQRISERQKAYGGIANIAEEITTATGESLRWPSNDDTANSAAIAAEGVAGAAGADLVFGNVTLGAFTYDSNGTGNAPLKVSLELLQDSAFDIAGFVARKLGERIGRKQAVDLATGAGTTEPFGLLSKTPDTMTATKTRLAAVEHVFQVDAAYRDGGNARWVMSDTTLAKYWSAVDLNGRPLFIPEASSGLEGQPGSSGRLVGYPVTIEPAAGDLVAFGDIRAGYIIRRVRSVQVLVDPYTAQATRQVAYHAWARMDANIQDAFAYSVSTYASVTADATA